MSGADGTWIKSLEAIFNLREDGRQNEFFIFWPLFFFYFVHIIAKENETMKMKMKNEAGNAKQKAVRNESPTLSLNGPLE